MKCHLCDGEAVLTVQLAGRYYLDCCIRHEDTVYHDLEMCLRGEMFALIGPEEESDEAIRQTFIDNVIQAIKL